MGKGKDVEKMSKAEYRKQKNSEKAYERKQREKEKWGVNDKRSAERKLTDQLKHVGLRVKDVLGDGNCLFRSISDQFEGNENNYAYYRKKIVQYMADNPDNFAPFVFDIPYEKYLDMMSDDGEWGGHIELQAASMCLGVNILIHVLDGPRMNLQCHANPDAKTIQLGYLSEQHYVSVRPIDIAFFGKSALVQEKELDFLHPDDTPGTSATKAGVIEISKQEKMIMESLACTDIELIRQTLIDYEYDKDAAIDLLCQCRDSWLDNPDAEFKLRPQDLPKPEAKEWHRRKSESDSDSDNDSDSSYEEGGDSKQKQKQKGGKKGEKKDKKAPTELDLKFGKKKISSKDRKSLEKEKKAEQLREIKRRDREEEEATSNLKEKQKHVDEEMAKAVAALGTISI